MDVAVAEVVAAGCSSELVLSSEQMSLIMASVISLKNEGDIGLAVSSIFCPMLSSLLLLLLLVVLQPFTVSFSSFVLFLLKAVKIDHTM